jgi:hypothetical protein
MAVDFQVVFPQELIQLNSVSELVGMVPRTVSVYGDDFRYVDQVEVNGFVSPQVVVLSKTRLLAQVPVQVGFNPVTSVSVVSNQLAITAQSVIAFQIGTVPSKVTGILRLVQIFLKFLFTTPGQDIFAPKLGGGVLKSLGATFGPSQTSNIVSNFVVSVATVQKQILALQARDPSLPADERLLTAKVQAAGFNKNETALVVSVALTSQTGKSALANLVI